MVSLLRLRAWNRHIARLGEPEAPGFARTRRGQDALAPGSCTGTGRMQTPAVWHGPQGEGAPDSRLRDGIGTPPRQTLTGILIARRAHQRGRSYTAKQRAVPWKPGSGTFRHRMRLWAIAMDGNAALQVCLLGSNFPARRAAPVTLSDTGLRAGTSAVRAMAGYLQGGGACGWNRQRAGAMFRAPGAGSAQGRVRHARAAAHWLVATVDAAPSLSTPGARSASRRTSRSVADTQFAHNNLLPRVRQRRPSIRQRISQNVMRARHGKRAGGGAKAGRWGGGRSACHRSRRDAWSANAAH